MANSLEFDLIICGSGLAGLRAAIEAAKKGPNLKIGVVSKVQVMRSHSVSAEGGTAAVLFEDEGDTIESHVYDTVKGSDFLADQDVAVVGGGNAGFETAAQLLAYTKSVTLIHRNPKYKADKITVDKVLAHPKMTGITNANTATCKLNTQPRMPGLSFNA